MLPISQSDEHVPAARCGDERQPMALACSWDSSVSAMAEQLQLSGVRLGPLQAGERITLTDPKGGAIQSCSPVVDSSTPPRAPSVTTTSSRALRGSWSSTGGTQFLAMRPLLNEFTVSMPRGAAVVYPKDAAQILMAADIFPGARVLEAGAGSGALTCSCCGDRSRRAVDLLRAA